MADLVAALLVGLILTAPLIVAVRCAWEAFVCLLDHDWDGAVGQALLSGIGWTLLVWMLS
jgi:hypothetical protein